MIVHVILAKRWNTFKKGHTETISDKTEVNSSVEKTLVGIFFDRVEFKSIGFIPIKIIESSFSDLRWNTDFLLYRLFTSILPRSETTWNAIVARMRC